MSISGYELAKLIEDERLVIEKQQRRIAELEREREALAAVLQHRRGCKLCRGTGYIQGSIINYETDSAAEREDARISARRPCDCQKLDPQAILASLRAAERKAGAVEALQKYQWRPISEAHEDYGTVVLCTVNDPGIARISHVLDDNWEVENQGMTHFACVPAFQNPPEQIEREVAS